ncbi:glycine oxidase ThiO [Pseudalkalibacillus sp. Hm43]|uniref:glycine oxidase ThiO n=1 Tax=Pseudalkalibacillus sp. Hm43 TaxID=3450742 RepID=UPI003F436AD1
MQTHYDAIIVGAGVIGSSIAYNLSKRGKKVLVLERGQIAAKASSAAAGMLGAQAGIEKDTPFFQLAKASRAMFPELAEELKELSGMDIELQQNGFYKVATSEEEAVEFKRLVQAQKDMGEEAEWIPPSELRLLEPALNLTNFGAMFIPNDGQVTASSLTTAYATSAVALGAQILEHTEVHIFVKEQNRIVGVETMFGEYRAEHVIVAGGAWSGKLLSGAGVTIDTYPVKGEVFSVKSKRRLVKGTISANGCYIVPKPGNRLIVGATEKAGTFDEAVTIEGISTLMERAKAILPELKDAEWERSWAGIRPQTGDSLPYLGAHPTEKGLYIATGHYRDGILLSAITGAIMADVIEGIAMKPEWASAFQIDRTTLNV